MKYRTSDPLDPKSARKTRSARPAFARVPDGLQREGAGPGRVVADGGDAALVDRQLDAERVLHGDDLRSGRPRREQPVGRGRPGDRHGAAVSRSEGGEKERHEASAGHDHERRECGVLDGLWLLLPRVFSDGRAGEAGASVVAIRGTLTRSPMVSNRTFVVARARAVAPRPPEALRWLGLERERTRDRERPVLVDCPEVNDFPCVCRAFVFLVVEAIPERHC